MNVDDMKWPDFNKHVMLSDVRRRLERDSAVSARVKSLSEEEKLFEESLNKFGGNQ